MLDYDIDRTKYVLMEDDEPRPWDQQPEEPPDHYGWFKIYLTLPLPRYVVRVAELAGMNPASRWISRVARKWRWEERAEALDAEDAQYLIVQSELRNQMLQDAAFKAQFQGLHDTNRALDNAAIGDMDRDEARQYLGALFQHQRGLLGSLTRQKEIGEVEVDDERLAELVMERVMEIRTEQSRALLNKVYGRAAADVEEQPDNSPANDKQEEIQ